MIKFNTNCPQTVFIFVGLLLQFPISRAMAQLHPPPVLNNRQTLQNLNQNKFATRILDYSPADGQYVNDPNFNDPRQALGAPVGGGTNAPDNSKLVTLGGFTGYITLGFAEEVRDDPANPFGIDVIIFGNGHWVGGNPGLRWSEAGIIQISKDIDKNGIADDPWYLIPGSDIYDPYVQQKDGCYILPDDPYASPPIFNPNTDGSEANWGYADMSPVLILGDINGDNIVDDPLLDPIGFYTIPDDPFTTGITPGSGGGDGFDIAWAIDPVTLEPANLDSFDFIKITTGVDSVGPFGEVSVEIGGVAIVSKSIIRYK